MTYSLIVTHIGRGADERGYPTDRQFKGEDASVYNPELLKAYTEPLAKELPKFLPMKPLIYGLGDETYFSYDAGFSPYDKRAFREYVRQRYGTLERLNAEWGTQFASWDEVEPIPYERCRKEGKIAAGIDLRMFNERSYADLHEMLRQFIRKFDPQARTASELGMIGDVPYFFDRIDFFCTTTDRRLHELFRSLPRVKNDPLFLLGDWWGGYVFNHGGRVGAIRLWRQILRGHANSSWFFFIVPSEEGALACDLRIAEYVQEMMPELQEIANGIGQLMANAKIISDGNAIFYSTVNEHVPQFYTAFDGQPAAQGSIIGVLDKLGVGYEFVTEDDIVKGALDKGDYQRLFLAGSIAISDEAAKAIAEFVSNGGIVIADLATGIMNGFGRLLGKGQLDELFGIARNSAPKPVTIVIKGSVALNGRKWTTEDLRVLSDASVKPTKAKALMQIDGVPLFVVNEFGKGKVLLCNFTLPGEDHPDAASLMQIILNWAGFELTNSVAEKWLLRRFRLGGLTLLSAIALPGAKDVKVRLSSPAWVYDVRKGKRLGRTNEIELSSKQQAWLFALAPTGTVKLSAQTQKIVRCGQKLNLQLKLEHQGVNVTGRILRVQIFRPDKSEAVAYRWYPSLSEPQTEISIPIALNDPVGRWSATVTDVATGTKATTLWEVKQ
ncbi:MAG: beta-galactosidase [Armatimonadetes bacterium]|nr:beta-galactosidase [Armatimonadota bacterium]